MSRESLRFAGWPILAITVALVSACRQPEAAASNQSEDRLSLSELLARDDTEGYQRALEPKEFSFPDDHGPHPDFRNEWWYLTGNLSSADGRAFGYQFTLFRSAISPQSPERESDWATRQIYMAHFALTDITGETFHAFERFSRGALGLAGVTTRPFRAWLEDWEIWADPEPPPFSLRVGTDALGLELDLDSAKPIVLQGDRGLSRKGREPGNASYYYSMTRLPTRGVVMMGLESYAVQGSSWLDREWSTSALEPTQTGWDWFALQLSDGRDLMIYQLRTSSGDVDPLSSGSVVARDGTTSKLDQVDFSIETLGWWISPATRVRYPAAWKIEIPRYEMELSVRPRIANQELDLSVLYWEGAVRVDGTSDGQAVTGEGYVELTGYDKPLQGAGED